PLSNAEFPDRGASLRRTAEGGCPYMFFLSFESAVCGFFSSSRRRSRCTTLGLPGAARAHQFLLGVPGLQPHRPLLLGPRPFGAGRNRRSCLALRVPCRL